MVPAELHHLNESVCLMVCGPCHACMSAIGIYIDRPDVAAYPWID